MLVNTYSLDWECCNIPIIEDRKRDIIILGALVGNEHDMSDTDESDWIKIDMAETGKLQILKTNWNQAQTFSEAKSLCDSKGGK